MSNNPFMRRNMGHPYMNLQRAPKNFFAGHIKIQLIRAVSEIVKQDIADPIQAHASAKDSRRRDDVSAAVGSGRVLAFRLLPPARLSTYNHGVELVFIGPQVIPMRETEHRKGGNIHCSIIIANNLRQHLKAHRKNIKGQHNISETSARLSALPT